MCLKSAGHQAASRWDIAFIQALKAVLVLSIHDGFDLCGEAFPVGIFCIAFHFFQGLPSTNRHNLVSTAPEVSQAGCHTLANLITNDNDLRASCDACGRSELLDIPTLVARYGDDMALPEIGQRRVLWSRKTVRAIICVGKWGVIRCS